MIKLVLSLLLVISSSVFALPKELNRIAFGSCNNQNDAQPLWKDLLAQRPDLWIWSGDAVYGDWKSAEALEAAFNKQNENKDYQDVKLQIPMIGTWDDHDFAFDNADGRLSYKKIAQKLYLDFLGEPADSSRRKQEGIYRSYYFTSQGHKIKVILLDNRYFKNLERDAEMLGNVQWNWLEEELKNSQADLHFFVTGLSIYSPLLKYTEEWREHRGEFNRLNALLKKYKPKGRVFLTGDKHFSSIFMRNGELEFLSSGMTHLVNRKVWWYLGRKYATTYFGLSYGQIDIDWEGDTPVLTMSMRSTRGRDIHFSRFRWQNNKWHWFE